MNTPPGRKDRRGNKFFAPLRSSAESSGDLDDSPPTSRHPTTDQEESGHHYGRPGDDELDSFGEYTAPEQSELESFSSPAAPKSKRVSGKQTPRFLRGLSSMGAPMARGLSKSASRAMSTIGRSMSLLGEHIGEVVGPMEAGVFDSWTRQEIMHVLIRDNIEVRDAQRIPLNVLREEADLFYIDRPIPHRPQPKDFLDVKSSEVTRAAERIQSNWVSAKTKTRKKERRPSRPEVASPVFRRAETALEMIPAPDDPMQEETMRRGFIETANSYIFMEEVDGHVPLDEDGKPTKVFALNEPWMPPSVEFAKEFANKNHPRQKVRSKAGSLESKKYSVLKTTTGRFCQLGGLGEQCDLWEEGQASEIGQFGPGITVYFKFVKFCFWMFVTLSFLYVFPLVGNRYGGYYADTDAVTDLALGTLGNLGGISGNNTLYSLSMPNCNIDWRGKDCEVSRSNTALLYSSVTFAGCIILLIGYLWLRLFEAREAMMLDKNTVEAADYSVKVQNLPAHCNEAELKAHFVRILEEHGEKQAVEDCTIAYDNEHEIFMYKQRGDLVKKRYRATQEYRYFKTLQITKEKPITDAQLEKIAKQRQDLTAQIHAIDQTLKMEEVERKKHKRVPICAYVTFQNTLGAQMALRLYGKSWLGYLFMRHKLRFKGNRLVVSRAPEPSTIIWENLRYTYRQRWGRRMGTAVISVMLLAVSAIASYAPRAIGETSTNAGGSDPCPDGFENLTRDEQREYVEDNSGVVYCYCDELSFYTQANDSTCRSYFKTRLYAQLILFGAAIVVLIVNALIDFSIRLCAKYEKHHSVDSMEEGIFIRMYFTKVINMGLLFLFGNNITVLGSLFGVSLPDRTTFSHDWFFTVGVNILLVEIGNIVTIHAFKVMRFVVSRYLQAQARKNPLIALTQDELNTLYLGPEFLISHRYAQVMADFTICLLFASAMPALIFIGMANFYVAYWIDKFLFLRFYRTPPRYSLQIGSVAASLIPYAVCAHVIVAIWAFGVSDELQTSNENEQEYKNRVGPYDALDMHAMLTQRHIIPLLALFVFLFVLIIMNIAVDTVFGGIQKLVKGIFGGILSKYEYYNELERYFNSNVQVSYSRAKQRGLIKGLVNYNILQNPIYKDAFAVDDSFAGKHRTLTSIQKATELSYFGEDKVNSFASDGPMRVNQGSDAAIAMLEGGAGVQLAREASQTTDTDGDLIAITPLGESVKAKKKNLTVVSNTIASSSPKNSPPAAKASNSLSKSPHAASPLNNPGGKQNKAFFKDATEQSSCDSPKRQLGPTMAKESDSSQTKSRRRKSETNSSDATLTEAALVALSMHAAEKVIEPHSTEKSEKKKRRHSVNARIEGGSKGLSASELQYLASLHKSHHSPMPSPRIALASPRAPLVSPRVSPRMELPPHLSSVDVSVVDRAAHRLEREEPLTAYGSRNGTPKASPRVDPAVPYATKNSASVRSDNIISAPRRNSERRAAGSTSQASGIDEDKISVVRRSSDRRELNPRDTDSSYFDDSHGQNTSYLAVRGREEVDKPKRRLSATGLDAARETVSTPDHQSSKRSSAPTAVPAALPSPRRKEVLKPPAPMSYEDIIRSYEHIDFEEEKTRPPIPPLKLGIAINAGATALSPRNELPSSHRPSPRGDSHRHTSSHHHHRHHNTDDENSNRLGGMDMLDDQRPNSARRK